MTLGRGYNETTHKTVYVLALTPEDVAHLAQGQPIHGSLDPVGLSAEVFLCSGRYADAITGQWEE